MNRWLLLCHYDAHTTQQNTRTIYCLYSGGVTLGFGDGDHRSISNQRVADTLRRKVLKMSITFIERGAAELVSIAVHPTYRRNGVGESLMHFTLRELQRRGVARWRLMVRIDNEQAIGFYRGFGFERIRTVRGYYGRGVDAWRMELRL
jgi:ribosomal protein S18 acetylase RimI-like enzyme